jgi:hypothetical protein
MRTTIASAIISTLLGSTLATNWWSNSNWILGGNSGDSWNIQVSYDVPTYWTSTYYSGVGPYYSSNIFTDITDEYHYEEYGFLFYTGASAGIDFVIGDTTTGDAGYYFSMVANADLLEITPYKQVIWFQRPLAAVMNGNSPSTSLWMGGAYEAKVGNAYVSYEEDSATFYEYVYSADTTIYTSGAYNAVN